MKRLFPIIGAALLLAGCKPSPVPKGTHIKEVQQAIAKAGGEANVLSESRTLFARMSEKTSPAPFYGIQDKCFEGLPGITNLGDVFYYSPSEPDRIRVRVHNNHFDTYFIDLSNPDRPEPQGFEKVAGNVGFIETKQQN